MKDQKSPSEKRVLGRRERKKADLKRRIEEVAIFLFRERGYENTTIDEIVQRVDVSQPTFYNYYPSKDAILREYALVAFRSLFSNAFILKGSITKRLRQVMRQVAKQMTEDRELWIAIAVSNAYNPIRDRYLLTSKESSTRIAETAIAEGQRLGEFTRTFSAQRLASFFEAIMFRESLEWGADFPDTRSLAKRFDEGFDFFLRAVRPQVGDEDDNRTSPMTKQSKRRAGSSTTSKKSESRKRS